MKRYTFPIAVFQVISTIDIITLSGFGPIADWQDGLDVTGDMNA